MVDVSPAKPRNRVTALRRRWRLSESQLGQLLMVSRRTVRRLELGECAPTAHMERFLEAFAHYISEHGLRQFRERFVGQVGRYGKAGRPRE